MIKTRWQSAIVNAEYDVMELIACKQSGKTTVGLAWGQDADVFIILSKHYKELKKHVEELTDKHHFTFKKIYVVGNLMQLRGISTPPTKNVKILVDEYFEMPEINLRKIDETLLHENYKVLFVGTRQKQNDCFKEAIAKHYNVDLLTLIAEGVAGVEFINEVINKEGYEGLEANFCSPFEIN